MIEAPPVGSVKLGLQTVHLLAKRRAFGILGEVLRGLVVCPQEIRLRTESAGHQIKDRAFDPTGNFLIELGHPEAGDAFALPPVGFHLSGQDTQQSGLPLPVSPKQADALLFVDGDAHVIKQERTAKGDGKVTITDQSHAKDLGAFAQGSKPIPLTCRISQNILVHGKVGVARNQGLRSPEPCSIPTAGASDSFPIRRTA